jgi:hypothetical protein
MTWPVQTWFPYQVSLKSVHYLKLFAEQIHERLARWWYHKEVKVPFTIGSLSSTSLKWTPADVFRTRFTRVSEYNRRSETGDRRTHERLVFCISVLMGTCTASELKLKMKFMKDRCDEKVRTGIIIVFEVALRCFLEPKGTLSYSLKPATGPYPETSESNSDLHTLFH